MTASLATPQALILAAGLGSRLRPLTAETPKPLVPVHGIPILHNALQNLASVGIRKATLVVGYRHELIERSCGSRFADVQLDYIRSSVFERTGSAYSLWLARDALLQADTILLEGDVFFDPELPKRLLASPHRDVAAVAPFTAAMSGSAVTLSGSGLISRILMNQVAAAATTSAEDHPPLFKTINLYRFSAQTLRETIVPALDEAIARNDCRCYVEQVLSRLIDMRHLELAAVSCGDINWFEIDSQEDLRIAEGIFASLDTGASAAIEQTGLRAVRV